MIKYLIEHWQLSAVIGAFALAWLVAFIRGWREGYREGVKWTVKLYEGLDVAASVEQYARATLDDIRKRLKLAGEVVIQQPRKDLMAGRKRQTVRDELANDAEYQAALRAQEAGDDD